MEPNENPSNRIGILNLLFAEFGSKLQGVTARGPFPALPNRPPGRALQDWSQPLETRRHEPPSRRSSNRLPEGQRRPRTPTAQRRSPPHGRTPRSLHGPARPSTPGRSTLRHAPPPRPAPQVAWFPPHDAGAQGVLPHTGQV